MLDGVCVCLGVRVWESVEVGVWERVGAWGLNESVCMCVCVRKSERSRQVCCDMCEMAMDMRRGVW